MSSSSRAVTLYPGAAETEPCAYGPPFPDLPWGLWLLAAPTFSGKSQIIQNIVLKWYRGKFARIWFFSPSVHIDPALKSLTDYLSKMTDQKREPLMFEEFDPAKVAQICEDQRAIVESCRKRKVKAPAVCLILDDLGDRSDLLCSRRGGHNGGSWLTTLACRSRHLNLSVIVSVQKMNMAGLVLRANMRCMCVWRLRNQKEIDMLAEELSGFWPKEVVESIYHHATAEPYSFLFCRLDAKTREDAFWLRFESRLTPQSDDTTNDVPGVSAGGSVGSGLGKPVSEQRPGQGPVRPARGAGGPAGKGDQDRTSDLRGKAAGPGKKPLPPN